MGLLKEFKEFAMKGSILDLAVAVIIGAAFGKIITSMVDNILMPVIGSFIGSNFAALAAHVNGVEIKYGLFLQATADFIIVAFLLFLIIKAINRFHRKKEVVAVVTPTVTEVLLMEIRDLLKKP
ncbi:MAG: large conductance mechanosensitive channel protein MscL [Ginsengibacter sp.]